MSSRHIFTALAITFVCTLCASGCGYMDEDIHLDDEEFMASIESEHIELGPMRFCGGGHWGSSGHHHGRRYPKNRASASGEDVLALQISKSTQQGYHTPQEPLVGRTVRRPGEDEADTRPSHNHEVIARIAKAHAAQ